MKRSTREQPPSNPVRAGDIGTWAFCHRAWWLSRVQDAPHRNPDLLAAGRIRHRRHGKQIAWAGRIHYLGILCIRVALVLAGLLLILLLFRL